VPSAAARPAPANTGACGARKAASARHAALAGHDDMKVLQLCSAEGFGGGESHVADLTLALVERGIEVALVVRPTSALPAILDRRAPALEVHTLPLRNSLDLLSVRALGALLAERKVDVLHAHVARDYPLAALARRGSNARLVLTRHHYLPIKGNVLYRRLLADATVVAVSDSVRATVLQSLKLPAERVVTISNWIDLAKFEEPRDSGVERRARGITRRVAVGLLGQIVPLKGHEEFVRAAALVVTERTDVEFLIFGDDRERGAPFKRKLEGLVDSLGLRDTVRFVGFDSDVAGALAALDVVAVPSWNEAFSLVTAEAMAMGRAIVASDAGALSGLVEHDVNGLLVPPRDPRSLAAAIVRLASDPALAERLGREAKRGAVRFAREPRVAEVVELYERVLRESKA
jgi:glycosyltransferase involved in cell wall biosynthesis